jgi:predicted nucleotidyltransferase
MDIELPKDFREFLRLLSAHGVEYVVVGGYAVGFHGYPRATNDLDVWIALSRDNAERAVGALREFGFGTPDLSPDFLLEPKRIIRMGVSPLRIEILNTISGVEFAECFARRISVELDGVTVQLIGLEDLKKNKKAAGRFKDLNDLENLP